MSCGTAKYDNVEAHKISMLPKTRTTPVEHHKKGTIKMVQGHRVFDVTEDRSSTIKRVHRVTPDLMHR